MLINIPIVLTLLRIVLIPVFVLVFYLPHKWANLGATIIFCVAAITDWLDGYLARKWKQTSAFGAFLDPVADKLMVACALVLLVDKNPTHFPGYVVAIPAGIIIGREIVISALREWMAELGKRAHVAVSIIGKVKTSAQMLAIPFLLYAEPISGLSTSVTGLILIYISAVLTIWSMFIYLRAAWPILVKSG